MGLLQYFSILLFSGLSISTNFWTDRDTIIKKEQSLILGSNWTLTLLEKKANDILMKYKLEEHDEGFRHPNRFSPARHFYEVKDKIINSNVFQFIQKLPKGASLHCHDEAVASGDFLYNLTYKDHLYACIQKGKLSLHFFNTPDRSCDWQLVSDLRRKNCRFDSWLKSKLSIIVKDPENTYNDINEVWNAFMEVFMTIEGLITYAPVWKEYFYQALSELYEDNVMYFEVRTILPPCYDLSGKIYEPLEVIGLYKEATDAFKAKHPDFHGVRIIYAPIRKVSNSIFNEYKEILIKAKNLYPDFVAGFDLVGQEDLGEPLYQFADQLMDIRDRGILLFHHSGETNWYGTSIDNNLIDAVLLNVTRIGHGFALLKHPEVARIVKERGIGIEVNPISNQVLKLVDDLRNHPATYLIAENYPVVITNDDPALWGSKGLSYDWYLAFMGMTSRNTDLKFLKQLALNSLLYSAMTPIEKNSAIKTWEIKWEKAIQNILEKRNTYKSKN